MDIAGTMLFFCVAFVFSTVCHESAHAWAAKMGGDSTAYHNGQLTLNPAPHIRQEPFGLLILPLLSLITSVSTGSLNMLGFGSAPYDPRWAVNYPKRAALMALAGPAANFAIAIAAALLLRLGLAAGVFVIPEERTLFQLAGSSNELLEGLAALLSIFFFENILLGTFNLLPVPPLDGFSALLLVVPEERAAWFLDLRTRFGIFMPLAIFALSSVIWRAIEPVLGFFLRVFF
ncbi:MAG: site-2 protease family protein [Bryobacteraceae bacterium]|nr:site-2 protease family protein [Bryobacteraceae bacterium]